MTHSADGREMPSLSRGGDTVERWMGGAEEGLLSENHRPPPPCLPIHHPAIRYFRICTKNLQESAKRGLLSDTSVPGW